MLPPAGAAGGASAGSGPAPGRSPRGRSSGDGQRLRWERRWHRRVTAGAGGEGDGAASPGESKEPPASEVPCHVQRCGVTLPLS